MSRLILSIVTLLLFCVRSGAQEVLSQLTPLATVPILTNTSEPPQSKTWMYAGKQWCVLGVSAGTFILRLDGTSWTNILSLASGNFVKADIKVSGNVTHILVHKGATSILYSVEYDVPTAKYKLWNLRKTRVDFTLESSNQTVTIDIDGTGRMWMASDGSKDINVRWSDAPYSAWSGPVKLDINTSTTDMCALVAMPAINQVGVFWSNKVTKRFGFKTHSDGALPTEWSDDEAPGSAGALNIGAGLADFQFNVKASANGRVYAAVKTGYNTAGNTQIGLLVRQASGQWDPLVPVTTFTGVNPALAINDSLGVLKVFYKMGTGIFYRQSALGPVQFGSETLAISGSYDYPSTAKAGYNANVVLLASTSNAAAGVLIADEQEEVADVVPPVVQSINRLLPLQQATTANSLTFRIIFSEGVAGVDLADFETVVATGTVSSSALSVTPIGSAATTYDVKLGSVTGNGTIRLDLASTGTGITDISDNAIETGFSTGQDYIISEAPPAIVTSTFTSSNITNTVARPGDQVNLAFTISTAVNLPVVTITGHDVTVVPASGNGFTAGYTMLASDGSGIIPFTIDFATVSGTSGVTATTTTDGSAVTFDRTIPTIQGINRQTPSGESITATAVTYRVTFSEPVTGVGITDFTVTAVSGSVGSVPGSVSAVGTAGTTYDIALGSLTGSGTFRLDLNETGTGITDVAGNELTGGFTGGQVYTRSSVVTVTGFASVTPLVPMGISVDTKDKPQSKAWKYAGYWWSVISVPGATKIYRLDGTAWTAVYTLATTTGKHDVKSVGGVAHILLYKGDDNNSFLYSIQYDPITNTYKEWSVRPTRSSIAFPVGSETATIAMDGQGVLWANAAGTSQVHVWYSNYPYSSWSSSISIASGIKDDDISAIVTLPAENKIGVFWSNQSTKRFGFRTHTDGDAPGVWSTVESPASASALDNIGGGMSDDHLNLKVASNGTVYVATKTSYNKTNYVKLALLVRRPNGIWDPLYEVTKYPIGTQPIVVLNETKGTLKMVYATGENGGEIYYRESALSPIAFGPEILLIGNDNNLYDYVSSTADNYSPDVVLIASKLNTSPHQLVGVLASDETSMTARSGSPSAMAQPVAPQIEPTVTQSEIAASAARIESNIKEAPVAGTKSISVFPQPFKQSATIRFTTGQTGDYSMSLYNASGVAVKLIRRGRAQAGIEQVVPLDATGLANGVYIIRVQLANETQVIRVLKN